MQPPAPSTDELAALASKYGALAALRARRDGGGPAATRGELRALATPYPGSLRELDTLGAKELARRAEAAAAGARGGALEPWMAWIWRYHRLMRAALDLKQSSREVVDAQAMARTASQVAGVALEVAFVQAVLHPPGGRIGPVVMQTLATIFQTPAEQISATLFPPRRPAP